MAPIEHVVEQGECVASIAANYRLEWQTIWDAPENAQLKRTRKNPNVLCPDDILVIPDKNIREENCDTDLVHRFVLKVPLQTLRVRLLDEFGHPRSGIKYELVWHKGKSLKGVTNKDGDLQANIPPTLMEARLLVGPEQREIHLSIGGLDPHTEISGIQARLSNLGFDTGPVDGVMGPRTEQALRDFQDQYNLTVTGRPDESTCEKLKNVHGH
jgi:hypothetical protein